MKKALILITGFRPFVKQGILLNLFMKYINRVETFINKTICYLFYYTWIAKFIIVKVYQIIHLHPVTVNNFIFFKIY
ncbi:hypothetical protein B1NLA3E_13490 [Bacillus sp. 1NLA3E]|nr:hypothetical protein B1NLA3E_13490 [Bacillus sp. 1NLA3E]